jgi:hypothetical protein
MHGDGADAELPAGPDHAERDLAPVRYQDFLEQRRGLSGEEGKGRGGGG